MKNFIFITILVLTLVSCSKSENGAVPILKSEYTISGDKILNSGKPIQLIGANAFHSFGASTTSNDAMKSWNIDIARVHWKHKRKSDFRQPNSGLKRKLVAFVTKIVDGNRLNNRITILCAFGWDGKSTNLFTGTMPKQTSWWSSYKLILQNWAIQFKNQPDVWIEVWNEPYRYDRADGYTDAIWITDMNEMVAIRDTGNQNIIVVPVAEQGQDESVLLNKGTGFLKNKTNILYDIHAYEKWLLDSETNINNRLELLKQKNLPIFWRNSSSKCRYFDESKPF
jgi:mannan endo-1,4-beta-mannosidase